MAVTVDSILRSEKLLKPVNPEVSNCYIPVKSIKFSGRLGLDHEMKMNATILKIEGIHDYLNTDDLKDFENMKISVYLSPAGCGPNDGIFFFIHDYNIMDNHSIMPEKYRIKILIDSTENGKIEDNFDLIF